MSYQLVRKEERKVSKWAGGETAEIAIFPEDKEFKSLDFLYRVSVASVEIEESVYTRLPGLERVLMVMKGKLILEHEGHHKSELNVYDQDRFMGDWTTHSWGCVHNLNLMTGVGAKGRMEVLNKDVGSAKLSPAEGYYLAEGKLILEGNTLSSGDFLGNVKEMLEVECVDKVVIIKINVIM